MTVTVIFALQSPTVRGSWGESSLKRCVELAGMSEFCDFDTQQTFFTDEGRPCGPTSSSACRTSA